MAHPYNSPVSEDFGFFIYLSFLIALTILLIDPLYLGDAGVRLRRDVGPIKYIVTLLALLAVFFSAVGRSIRPLPVEHRFVPAYLHLIPLLLFAALVMTGSIYARTVAGTVETYLQFGLSGLLVIVPTLVARRKTDINKLNSSFMIALGVIAAAITVWTISARLQDGQAFHEEIFLYTPLIIYTWCSSISTQLKRLLILVILIVTIYSQKNTAYILAIFAVAHLAVLHKEDLAQALPRLSFAVWLYVFSVILVLLFGLLIYIVINRDVYLPTGNAATRLQVYHQAIEKFYSSPLVGDIFSTSSLYTLTGIRVLGRSTLVAHSDFLDILSHGGIFMLLLLILGLYLLLRDAINLLHARPPSETCAFIHTHISLIISGLLVGIFNPMLSAYATGSFFWLSVGILHATISNNSAPAEGLNR